MTQIINTMKKLGFSDKFGVVSSIVVAVFCFCCLAIYAFMGKDTILYLTAALGFLGTQIGFLYNKNTKENVVKLSNSVIKTETLTDVDNQTPTI